MLLLFTSIANYPRADKEREVQAKVAAGSSKTGAIAAAKDFMAVHHPAREWWIVGGLLRDDALGRAFKDVDIFINGREGDLLPLGCDDLGDRNAYLLRAVKFQYDHDGGTYELNLIFMRGSFWTLESITDRCDFGICQIGYDPVNDVEYRSAQFEDDLKDECFTMCRETTQERVERMEDKFPEYTYRNPKKLSVGGSGAWFYNSSTGSLDRR